MPPSKKRIGILGGISHESTGKYYELLHQKYFQKFGNYYFPEVVIFSLDFQKFTDFEDTNNMVGYIDYILSGIRVLEDAHTDVIIMAANSPHSVFDDIQKQTDTKMISIVEVTAEAAKEKNYKKLLLLGIKYTMQKNFYAPICAKYAIEVLVPSEDEQNEINNIIFKELCLGKVNDASRVRLLEIMKKYDVDATILGCTELPLILDTTNTTQPLLNPMDIHVESVLKYISEG
ncbi:amino acid racemase [Candidatus Peregrinibacteria bacterium]|nr:amino acid racemase [Candidatus Peregrinibacteria bacterium]